jgi:hypothetical protein
MGINNSQRAACAPELIGAMTGSAVQLGPLLYNPTIIIFDNQSDAAVVLDWNLVQFKTFTAGEAMILDLRAAHGLAANYTFSIGDTFFATGAGTGDFSISYLYASNP